MWRCFCVLLPWILCKRVYGMNSRNEVKHVYAVSVIRDKIIYNDDHPAAWYWSAFSKFGTTGTVTFSYHFCRPGPQFQISHVLFTTYFIERKQTNTNQQLASRTPQRNGKISGVEFWQIWGSRKGGKEIVCLWLNIRRNSLSKASCLSWQSSLFIMNDFWTFFVVYSFSAICSSVLLLFVQ